MIVKLITRSAFVAAAAAAATACQDGPTAPTVPLSALVPAGAVQAVIQQQSPSIDGSVTFVVRVLANAVGVSSYQGAVTFDAGAFELVSANAPDGADGEGYVMNPAEFGAGRIRFAAFAPTTFTGTDAGDGTEAFRFTVKANRPVEQANLEVTLDVVGKETGAAVASDRVLSSRGAFNTAGRLIR